MPPPAKKVGRVKVRNATRLDMPAILLIDEETGGNTVEEEFLAAMRDPDKQAVLLVAEVEGGVLGFLMYERGPNRTNIVTHFATLHPAGVLRNGLLDELARRSRDSRRIVVDETWEVK